MNEGMESQAESEVSIPMTEEEKSNAIMTAEKGVMRVPIYNQPVPPACLGGFGTWSPIKPECVLCPFVASCFCRATDTPPRVISIQKKTGKRAKKEKSMSDASDGTTSSVPVAKNPMNPFRRGTDKQIVRDVILAFVAQGESKADTQALYQKAEELGYSVDTKKDIFMHVLWEYDPRLWPIEKASDTAKSLHGLVRFVLPTDESKPVKGENHQFEIHVQAISAMIEQHKNEQRQKEQNLVP